MATGQRGPKTPILWHYTTADRLTQILAAGELRPMTFAKKVKSVVWFTTRTDWEPMANRVWRNPEGVVHRLGKDQTIVLGGGLARIAVAADVAPVDWKTYKAESDLPPKIAQHIYNEAVSLGSRPGDWYATWSSVPKEKWLRVEIWEDEAWVARREG
jgi:hypothetical protein